MFLVIYMLSLAADGVGPLSRGPHELRERVGRAEAQVASMLRTTFSAILLLNAKFELLIFIFYCPHEKQQPSDIASDGRSKENFSLLFNQRRYVMLGVVTEDSFHNTCSGWCIKCCTIVLHL